MSRRRKITVRVDGSRRLGMGHVTRCGHLTRYLEQHITPLPEISILSNDENTPDPEERLLHHLATHSADLLLVDSNWADNPEIMESLPDDLPIISLHEHNFPVLTGVAAAINPSIVEQMPPPGYELGRTHFQGPAYLMLDEEIPALAQNRRMEMKQPVDVVVSLGGSDPEGITLRVVDSLADMRNIQLHVIIGPAFPDETIAKLFRNSGIIVHHKPITIAPILADANIAITNAATTMFESIALGLPTIAIPQNPYEAIQADICAKAGAAMTVSRERIENDLPALVEHLISDPVLRQGLSSKGRSMIDGLGLPRVANIIIKHLRL